MQGNVGKVSSKSVKPGHIKHEDAKEKLDPFPGPAPIAPEKLKKYKRGVPEKVYSGVKTNHHKMVMLKKEKKISFAARTAARAEMLLPEESGFLEPDQDQFTAEVRQVDLKNSVDITSATKQFDLNLKFGPYSLNYSRNGRKMLIGGRMGHVAAFDWVTKDLLCEMNVMESVHDVCWLHNETMFAVAQKEWTYMYDNQGIEVHCIKKMDKVLKMEFLPYHFLLTTGSEKGWLSWLDVSIGKLIRQTSTHNGRLDVMCQNPSNAVICAGHSKGTVTFWTPNVETPVAKMLCHKQPIRACTVEQKGHYMATAAVDSTLKIWDLRMYKCLGSYRLGSGASQLSFSQRGMLGVSLGNIVEVYKDVCKETARYPYLKHQVGSTVTGLEFCPFEDVLGVSHLNGMCSMLVPGSGEPNFDALETNPFQTKSQRREAEVKSLLEKIQPELITMDPTGLGEVDRPSVLENFEAKTKYMFKKPPKVDVKPRKNAKTADVFHNKKRVQHEARKRHIVEVGEKSKEVKEVKEESKTKKVKPVEQKTVLDRFKPQAKKRKTVK